MQKLDKFSPELSIAKYMIKARIITSYVHYKSKFSEILLKKLICFFQIFINRLLKKFKEAYEKYKNLKDIH